MQSQQLHDGMDVDDSMNGVETESDETMEESRLSGVQVEGSSGSRALRIWGWREDVHDAVGKDRPERREQLKKLEEAQAERRRRQEEDVKMWLAARTFKRESGKENDDGGEPHLVRPQKRLPRRKTRIRNEMAPLNGVLRKNNPALTQFDLSSSGIFSPATILEQVSRVLGDGKEEDMVPDSHLAYHNWVSVHKALDDPVLMDSFRGVRHENDDIKWGLLSDCVFEQLQAANLYLFDPASPFPPTRKPLCPFPRSTFPMVELATANADRIPSAPPCRKDIYLLIDPRKSEDAKAIVRSARRMVALFYHRNAGEHTHNLNDDRELEIYVNIVATEQGIIASRELEETGIKTNLTQISNLEHALACFAWARSSCVTINVGRILKWYDQRDRRRASPRVLAQHPGIETIRSITRHFKGNGSPRDHESIPRTRILAENFQTAEELRLLTKELDGIVLNGNATAGVHIIAVPASTRDSGLPGNTGTHQVAIATAASPAILSTTNENEADGEARQEDPESRQEEARQTLNLIQAMSAESRSIFMGTVFSTLGNWKVGMNTIQRIIQQELHIQARVKIVDLKAFYTSQRMHALQEASRVGDGREWNENLTDHFFAAHGLAASPRATLDQGEESFLQENDHNSDSSLAEMAECESCAAKERETTIIDNIIRGILEEEVS
ncbi:hypothetical protein PQX77_000856 [Marasmius sp. AFHP31]|nr:hypothetical protein PQX77_000856 [Marasmius sp. AFHP31]